MKVQIFDGMSQVQEEFSIERGRIVGSNVPACLADVDVSGMDAHEAREAIFDAYAGPDSGYDGDPAENGLAIHVEE